MSEISNQVWDSRMDYDAWYRAQKLAEAARSRGQRVPGESVSLKNWGKVEGQEELF